MKKRYLLAGVFLLALVVALLAVACSKDAATTTTSGEPTTTLPPATGEPIKIGHIVDATGVEAQTGLNMQHSLELAFEAINYRIGDRPVQIITENASDDPALALARAKKLVEVDKVVAIFGPTAIGEKYTVSQYMKTNPNGVPLIMYSPTPEIIWKDNPWLVAAGGTNIQQPSCMADYVYNVLGYRTVATLGPEGAAGQTFITPFAEEFKALGGKIAGQVWPPETALDMGPFLTTLDLTGVDALVYWYPGANAQKLIIAFDQLGIDIPKVGAFHGATFDPWVFKDLKNPKAAAAMVGVPVSMEYGPDVVSAANTTFVDLWTAKYPTKSGPQALDGSNSNPYDIAQLFIKVLQENGGDTTPAKLMQGLLSTPWEGPQGRAFFDKAGKFPAAATRNVYIVKVVANDAGSEWPYRYETVMIYEAVPPTGYIPGKTVKTAVGSTTSATSTSAP